MTRTALYRFYDHYGDLLYVGVSVTPWSRWKQHKSGKDWAEEVRTTELEWFDSRPEAMAAEKAAIVAEEPRYNVQHSVLRLPAPPPARLWIAARCSECGDDIPDGDGYLEVSVKEAELHADAVADLNARYPLAIPAEDLMRLPDPAGWYAWHRDCDPGPDDEGYTIEVDSIRTLADFLDWVAHLSEKPWVVQHTLWSEFLRDIAEGDGPLVIQASFLKPKFEP